MHTGSQPVLVGHSIGGSLALGAARDAPERVSAVVAYEAPLLWEPWWPRRSTDHADSQSSEAIGEQFMRRIVGDATWEALPERAKADRRTEGAALICELGSAGSLDPVDLTKLSVAVIVGRGSGVEAHRSQAAEQMLAEIPNAVSMAIDGAPHNAHMTHPVEFAALVEYACSLTGGTDSSLI